MVLRFKIGLLFALFSSDAFSLTAPDVAPDSDSFVRAADPNRNYGGAGALTVSGSTAVNGSAVSNGPFDSFLRFSLASTVTQFNTAFGAGNWMITGLSLKLTEMATPNNALFNRGQGTFEIRWLASDSLSEGNGTPAAASTTGGIVYNDEPTILNSSLDISLGTNFSNAQANSTQTFILPTTTNAFISDVMNGNEVEFFLTATNPSIGFTFNSRTGGGAPALSVTAESVPEPATVALLALGAAGVGLSRRRQLRGR